MHSVFPALKNRVGKHLKREGGLSVTGWEGSAGSWQSLLQAGIVPNLNGDGQSLPEVEGCTGVARRFDEPRAQHFQKLLRGLPDAAERLH